MPGKEARHTRPPPQNLDFNSLSRNAASYRQAEVSQALPGIHYQSTIYPRRSWAEKLRVQTD